MTHKANGSSGCRLVGRRSSYGLVGAVFKGAFWFLAIAALFVVPANAENEYAVMAKLAPQSLLLAGALAGDRIVVVGERGHILVSEDHGESWRQVERVPTKQTLMGVAFAGNQLGFAVGGDSLILRTRDGGASWEQVHLVPEWQQPLFDVLFLDDDSALAVGAYGLVLRTDDGGDHWVREAMVEEADCHVNRAARSADGMTLYAAAEAGRMFRLRFGEEQWEELASPYKGSFFGILPLQNRALIAYGLRGNLFRSDDDGQSWRHIETGSEALLAGGAQLADGTLVVVGSDGVVLVSRDDGETFQQLRRDDRRCLSAFVSAGGTAGVLVGEMGVRQIDLATMVGYASPLSGYKRTGATR